MIVTTFRYLILISTDFKILFLRLLLSLGKILKTLFDHISKHREVRQSTPLCGETRFLVFDILLKIHAVCFLQLV